MAMRRFLYSLILALSCVAFAAQKLPDNHVDLTSCVLDFLSRTELCLGSCQDAASVQAALPQLKELKNECAQIIAKQQALPEPTVQDYMAVQNQMEAFNTIWNAIRAHIARLEESNLMNPELRDILRVAPPAK